MNSIFSPSYFGLLEKHRGAHRCVMCIVGALHLEEGSFARVADRAMWVEEQGRICCLISCRVKVPVLARPTSNDMVF